MNMPGFTAEAALNGSRRYWWNSKLYSTSITIIPQLSILDSLFAGCFRNCVSRCGGSDSYACITGCNFLCSGNPWIVFFGGGITSL